MLEGHRCTIITHDEFQEWIEGASFPPSPCHHLSPSLTQFGIDLCRAGFGIGFRQAGGDPAALMKLSVEHKVRSSCVCRLTATD